MNDDSKKQNAEKPTKTVRHGAIAANIWKRMAPNGFEYYDFSLSRSWKSKSSQKEGYSTSFFANNEAEITAAVRDAASWIASQQASMLASPEATKTAA